MNDADKILNEVTIDSKRENFIRHINDQKCPFRCYADGGMKYCDPNCMALSQDDDYNYVCLRLVNINYQANYMNLFEIESED